VDAACPRSPGGWDRRPVYVRLKGKYTSASARIDSASPRHHPAAGRHTLITAATSAPSPASARGPCTSSTASWPPSTPRTSGSTTGDDTLYAWAPGGAAPRGIEYKARTEAFDLDGKSHVHVIGLRLKAANVSTDASSTGQRPGPAGRQLRLALHDRPVRPRQALRRPVRRRPHA
jgi:hypothetical protein